uniref:Uncharacterized protein n=1 Tax=Cucumis melo TaxID=3656 RepID=A0A9I9E7T1_CUCME
SISSQSPQVFSICLQRLPLVFAVTTRYHTFSPSLPLPVHHKFVCLFLIDLFKLLLPPCNVHHQFDQSSWQTFFLSDDHLVCSTDDHLVRITQTTIWYVLRLHIGDDHLVHSLAAYHRCTRRTFLSRTSHK